MVTAETPYIEIIHDICRIVPVYKTVFKRGQEGTPRQASDARAQKGETVLSKEGLGVIWWSVHVPQKYRYFSVELSNMEAMDKNRKRVAYGLKRRG